MIIKKKALVLFALMLCICIVSLFVGKNFRLINASGENKSKPQIIIDAGHGGSANTINTILKNAIFKFNIAKKKL